MKVSPVSLSPISNNKVSDSKCRKNVSFTAYEEIVQKALMSDLKNDRMVENLFNTLYKALLEEKNIILTKEFPLIKQLYEKGGFRGLLNELWKARPQEQVESLMRKYEQRDIDLVLKKENPFMQIFRMGRYGFFESSNSPFDTKVIFKTHTPEEIIEFGLTKKGRITVGRSDGDMSVDTEYHTSTGAKRLEIIQSYDMKPDRTFFNKDGNEPFFKNWFFGGTAPEVW